MEGMRMTDLSYVAYTDDVEQPQPDEDELIEKTIASMRTMREEAFQRHQHGLRDAHAKSHAVLRGELIVDADLPDHLRQGLFAQPATYPIIVRISSAQAEIRSDQNAALRGFAIKVLGVSGPRSLPGDEGTNHDIMLVNYPTLPFGDVRKYLAAQEAALEQSRHPELPAGAEIPGAPNVHVLGETFHSMAAIRYGDFIAKLSAAPLSESVRALTGQPVDPALGPGALSALAAEFFANNGAEYELRAQLCADLETMPVEDASVLWPESQSPHRPIGKVAIPAQQAYSTARRIYADDVLSFNPWHSLAAHRPLGSVNRARIKAYQTSSVHRHQLNDTPRIEPRDISDLPA